MRKNNEGKTNNKNWVAKSVFYIRLDEHYNCKNIIEFYVQKTFFHWLNDSSRCVAVWWESFVRFTWGTFFVSNLYGINLKEKLYFILLFLEIRRECLLWLHFNYSVDYKLKVRAYLYLYIILVNDDFIYYDLLGIVINLILLSIKVHRCFSTGYLYSVSTRHLLHILLLFSNILF